jgi:hypothetical protein
MHIVLHKPNDMHTLREEILEALPGTGLNIILKGDQPYKRRTCNIKNSKN